MKRTLLAAILTASAAAQTTLPALPGLIVFAAGRVTLDGKPVEVWPARAAQIPDGASLHNESGRAQVLLNPCTVLNLGERSTLRMTSNSLTAMRLELVAGSVVVEDDSGNHRRGTVELTVGGNALHIDRDGIYRFDTAPPRVRVFAGVLEVKGLAKLTAGRSLTLGGKVAKFDRRQIDDLQKWSDLLTRHLMDDSGILAQVDRPLDRPRVCVE